MDGYEKRTIQKYNTKKENENVMMKKKLQK